LFRGILYAVSWRRSLIRKSLKIQAVLNASTTTCLNHLYRGGSPRASGMPFADHFRGPEFVLGKRDRPWNGKVAKTGDVPKARVLFDLPYKDL
jgi:hypothetical protein